MLTFFTLLVLGILLGIVLMQLFKKQTPAAGPVPDLAGLKITDARAGDALSISGAGDNYTDLDFTADRLTRYEAGTRRWFELSGPYRERRVAVRVGGGEEVEVSLHSDPRKLTIEDLGLAEEELAEMDERQNTADSFQFDGKAWLYRLSREVQSTLDGQAEAAGFYYWEFQEQNGKGMIAIRKAEAEPFTVTLYTGISAADVTVYRARSTQPR
jgi:hypothetical protein